jgi:hypothetical protein
LVDRHRNQRPRRKRRGGEVTFEYLCDEVHNHLVCLYRGPCWWILNSMSPIHTESVRMATILRRLSISTLHFCFRKWFKEGKTCSGMKQMYSVIWLRSFRFVFRHYLHYSLFTDIR